MIRSGSSQVRLDPPCLLPQPRVGFHPNTHQPGGCRVPIAVLVYGGRRVSHNLTIYPIRPLKITPRCPNSQLKRSATLQRKPFASSPKMT